MLYIGLEQRGYVLLKLHYQQEIHRNFTRNFPKRMLNEIVINPFQAARLSRGFLIFSLGIERVTEKC